MTRLVLCLLIGSILLPRMSEAATVRGRVHGGDGPLAGVVVVFEDSHFAATDAAGRFTLHTPGPGLVWVRPPDGYSPRPVWRAVDGDADLELFLEARPVRWPLRFVHVSDLHVGVLGADEVRQALAQAADDAGEPHVVIATGDLTQTGTAGEFDDLARATSGLTTPIVLGTGNHDVYDGGKNFRRALGPSSYSFDAGGVHFAVVDGTRPVDARLAFLERDLARVPAGTPTFVFLHFALTLPHDQAFYAGLVRLGVRHVFTGHLHTNSEVHFPGLTDHNVQPLAMAGIQLVPAGYQHITVIDGEPVSRPHFVVDEPFVSLVWPRAGGCSPSGRVPLIAAVELGPGELAVSVRLDGGAPVALVPAGGWDHLGEAWLDPGVHVVDLEVRRGDEVWRRSTRFCVAAAPPAAPESEWRQLGGGPQHTHAVDFRVAPPLAPVWATSVGGFVLGGSPVLADGRLFVPVADLGSQAGGGLVALDAGSGEILWEQRIGGSLTSSPALAGDLVIVSPVDGVVRAFEARTGQPVWQVDLGVDLAAQNRGLHASPLVDGEVVYAGHMYRLAALDRASGAVLWQAQPSTRGFVSPSPASPAIAGERLVGVFGHGAEGILAFAADDGAPLWRITDGKTRAMTASPLLAGNTGYFASSEGSVFAADLRDGTQRWQRDLLEDGHEFAYWMRAAPALAEDRLFVPTQQGAAFALSAEDGELLWRHPAGPGNLRTVHYAARASAFSSSPVVTADVVWLGGDDGVLSAVEAVSGERLGHHDLGVPLLAGIVPAAGPDGQRYLFVASFDGTVRALAGAAELAPTPAADELGCEAAPGSAGASAPLVLLVLALGVARRAFRAGRARRPAA